MQVTALIVSEYSEQYSHWNAKLSLGEWLKQHKVPGLFGIDTRQLTKIIREKGSIMGKIVFDNDDPVSAIPTWKTWLPESARTK